MNTRRRIQPPRSLENLKPPGRSTDPNLFAEQTLLPTVGHPAVVCQLPGSMKLLYLFQHFNFPISDFRCALKVPIETQKIKHLSSAPKNHVVWVCCVYLADFTDTPFRAYLVSKLILLQGSQDRRVPQVGNHPFPTLPSHSFTLTDRPQCTV